jgi:hypothetical protein
VELHGPPSETELWLYFWGGLDNLGADSDSHAANGDSGYTMEGLNMEGRLWQWCSVRNEAISVLYRHFTLPS